MAAAKLPATPTPICVVAKRRANGSATPARLESEKFSEPPLAQAEVDGDGDADGDGSSLLECGLESVAGYGFERFFVEAHAEGTEDALRGFCGLPWASTMTVMMQTP